MTFSRASREIKCGDYYRNRPHFDDRWSSIYNESFENPKNLDSSYNDVPTKKVKFIVKVRNSKSGNLGMSIMTICRLMVSGTGLRTA